MQDNTTFHEKTVTRLYKNTVISGYTNIKLSRGFKIANSYTLPVEDSLYASFFDLDENGQLDILLVTYEGGVFKTVGFYNNYIYDAFFLKSVTLLEKDYFMTNELGANYRYIVTNLDGSRRMDVSFQGIQTSDNYLNLPYAFIGIGRSNNYIENFHVISITFYKGQYNYKIFTPVIPNSQLIITKSLDVSTDPPKMYFNILSYIIL
jgi:integrin alpha FG-GAP repeat containing protein 1